MAYHDTKQAAVDPDNPGPTEQIPYSEWNTMVEDFRRKIHEIAVDITALGDDKILVYKAASASFVFEVVNAISALNNLSDVTISGVPANDEVLAYSMAAGKWINQTAAEAGLATSTDLAAHLPLAGGTMSGDLNMGDHDIVGLVNIGAQITDGIWCAPPSGIPAIALARTPYAFEAYADANMNAHKIVDMSDPTDAQDAVTRHYTSTHLLEKVVTLSFLDGYGMVYRTASGRFEMEDMGGGGAAGFPVVDTTAIIKGSGDGTKLMRFEVDGITTGVTRVMAIPDKDITLCDTAEVMLLSGTHAMSGDLAMGGNDLLALGNIRAQHPTGIECDFASGSSAISLACSTYAFDAHANVDMGGNYIMNCRGVIPTAPTTLTISAGTVSSAKAIHTIDTELSSATDDLDSIGGYTSYVGRQLIIMAEDSARTVVCKDGTGNLRLNGDMSLDNVHDTLSLIWDGTSWLETARSNNSA